MAKKKKNDKAAPKGKAPKQLEFEELDAVEDDDDAEDDDADEKPKKKSASRGGDSGSVYKIIEVVGSSPKSWEHAAQVAVERASQTLDDLRVAEVVDQDLKIEDGAIAAYRTKLRLSFKFRD